MSKTEAKIAARAKPHTVYRTADGQRVPGVTTVLGILNKPALIKWANNLGLQGIDSATYVDETARGQRVGEAIYRHIVGYARSIGCYNVTLNVWEGNDRARAFYEKMGFGIQKTLMEKIL